MRVLLTIAVMFSFAVTAPSPRRKNVRAGALVTANKPAVFLSFLRSASIKPDGSNDNKTYLLFKLTNNTRWPIWLQMEGVTKQEYGEARLFYTVEHERHGRVLSSGEECYVCPFKPLEPGKSITFSLEQDEVSRESWMRIAYSFEWERKKNEGGSSSEHSVVFLFKHLPSSVLSAARSNNGIKLTACSVLFNLVEARRQLMPGVRRHA